MLLNQRAAEAYQARHVERQLTAEVEKQASQAAWFTRGYQEGIQLGFEIEQARKADDTLKQRIDYFTLEKSAPGFVRLFSAARQPDQPYKHIRKKLLLGLAALALVAAVLVPIGIDFLDPRLHSPSQVTELLGFAPISWIMEKQAAGPSFAREQTLRLASRINQERQSHCSRVFAFTSVKSRGGTSTIVVETAQALALVGISALALEANSYHSDPRYSKPDVLGLTAILSGIRPFHSEVIPADGQMPDRIPVGSVGNGSNLPDTHNLRQLLYQAAQTYDIVLIDTPPILASVDAEILACSADVVALVVEAESVTREELRRAAKSLERLNVRAVSAIFNKVRRDEATGVAATVLHEFLTGTTMPAQQIFSPWLWR